MKPFTLKNRSEVEIRVAQEIKNHQDALYHLGQQIEAVANAVKSLAGIQDKCSAKSESELKKIAISVENFQQETTSALKGFAKKIVDNEATQRYLQKVFAERVREVPEQYVSKEDYVKSTAFFFNRINGLEEKLAQKSESRDSEMSRMKNFVLYEAQKVRKEIPCTEGFEPLKKDVQERLQAYKIDFEGLVREIEILKKNALYDQKKIENLYTLIGRLKERVA